MSSAGQTEFGEPVIAAVARVNAAVDAMAQEAREFLGRHAPGMVAALPQSTRVDVVEMRSRPDPATQPDAWRSWYDETQRCCMALPPCGGRCYQERCSPTSRFCAACDTGAAR